MPAVVQLVLQHDPHQFLRGRGHITESLPERNHGKAVSFKVLHHLRGIPPIICDLADIVFLTQIADELFDISVVDDVSLRGLQVSLPFPDIVLDVVAPDAHRKRILRKPEIRQHDILLVLVPGREDHYKCSQIAGRGKIKVITGKDTRWSYCNVWDAKSINGGTPKFSVSLIIPKSDEATVRKIKAAIDAAYHDGESKLRGNGKTVPPLVAIKNPLRDGDTERPDDPAYKNAYFVNANSATAPGVVDADCNPILTRSEVYSGVYGRASISFYAFNSNGNRGIACGLNNLQKIRDGEPLGGRASAESDFADDDEDFLS